MGLRSKKKARVILPPCYHDGSALVVWIQRVDCIDVTAGSLPEERWWQVI
jgi:hypothetical protein